MKFLIPAAAGTALAFAAMASTASAQDCTFDKKAVDFEQADIDALYACVKDKLAAGYAKEGHEIGSVYRDWQATSTGPAAPGPHGDRFLFTYANDVGYAQYVKYADEGGFAMPVGSVLAKESYKLSKKGKPRNGPLFIMTKVDAGEADEFGNWVYSAVQPNGKNMKIKQSFCHDCHAAFADQDSLGYPDVDVRFSGD
ncbi:cytochrome P460 family protein [Sulfitobacter aestuariivivens]|uniref:Cytochrome P460 family protein n=1 Tax=Sulfitobacter aestuariivivens TaxID=2766981 RepID=A0A927HDP0_9RHOB|nr:cytochrome P460 family protein [Sulfitobacter aestuariivivens]MBD3663041.1 cytochrome P460 family protein [Sulfitobacter aestuariivivens]